MATSREPTPTAELLGGRRRSKAAKGGRAAAAAGDGVQTRGDRSGRQRSKSEGEKRTHLFKRTLDAFK